MFLLSLSPVPRVLLPRVANFLNSSRMACAFVAKEPGTGRKSDVEGPVQFIKGPKVDCGPHVGVYVLCTDPDNQRENDFTLLVCNYGSEDHSTRPISSTLWTPGTKTLTMNWYDPKMIYAHGFLPPNSPVSSLQLSQGLDGSARISMDGEILSNDGIFLTDLVGDLGGLARQFGFDEATDGVALKLMNRVPLRKMDSYVASQYPIHAKVVEQLPQE